VKHYLAWLPAVAKDSRYLFHQHGGAEVFKIYTYDHVGLADDQKFWIQGLGDCLGHTVAVSQKPPGGKFKIEDLSIE